MKIQNQNVLHSNNFEFADHHDTHVVGGGCLKPLKEIENMKRVRMLCELLVSDVSTPGSAPF